MISIDEAIQVLQHPDNDYFIFRSLYNGTPNGQWGIPALHFVNQDNPEERIQVFPDSFPGWSSLFPPEPEPETYDEFGRGATSDVGFWRYKHAEDYIQFRLDNLPSSEFRQRAVEWLEDLQGAYWAWRSSVFAGTDKNSHIWNYIVKVRDIDVDLNGDGDFTDPGEFGYGRYFSGIYLMGEKPTFVYPQVPLFSGPEYEWVKDNTGTRQLVPNHHMIFTKDVDGADEATINEAIERYIDKFVASLLRANRDDLIRPEQ